MAARGTEFIGLELREQVRGNYDQLIAKVLEEIEEMKSADHAARHRAWRSKAEAQVKQLWIDVTNGSVTDSQLSSFSISSPPTPYDYRYTLQSKESEVERLSRARDKAVAYINSLAKDHEGVVTLGAADLRRIGYQP